MARRRKRTTTKRRRTTKRGMARRTARKAYSASRRNPPRRRARRNQPNGKMDMQALIQAAGGGAAAALISQFVPTWLPPGQMTQWIGPAANIGLGLLLANMKTTRQFQGAGYGMVAVGTAELVARMTAKMMDQAPAPVPPVSAGWFPASVVGQRYMEPAASQIPRNSFLANIVVPS